MKIPEFSVIIKGLTSSSIRVQEYTKIKITHLGSDHISDNALEGEVVRRSLFKLY